MTVTIRFYEELNFFLSREKQKTAFQTALYTGQTVKDLIESLGVPHTEVDLVLVNGESVDFSFQPPDSSSISVYPVFETFSLSNVTRLRPNPLRNPAFILDVHLGTLARYIRLLGFPALYRRDWKDAELALYAEENSLILLTCDRGLLKRKMVSRGMFVHASDPLEQVQEVCRRLQLSALVKPFSRCLSCGGMLDVVLYGSAAFERIKENIPPGVLSWCREYRWCASCGKVYWEGSHMDRLRSIVESVTEEK